MLGAGPENYENEPPSGGQSWDRAWLVLVAAAALVLGCVHGRGPEAAKRGTFSGSLAWEHVLTLSKDGAREPGSEEAAEARRYIEDSLRSLGAAEVREVVFEGGHSAQAVHLLGVLPGESKDILVLAASYDAASYEPPGSTEAVRSASGAALVLELGRALAGRKRPYTLWLVFLDAEAVPADSHVSRHYFHGSEHWADVLMSSHSLDRMRAMVYFDDVANPTHPIARDTRSHGIYRDVFFDVAEEQGHELQFPRRGHFRSPDGGHRALLSRGVRRVVAINGESPIVPHRVDPSRPSATPEETLAAVGEVSVEAINRIARQLKKIDEFVMPREDAEPQASENFDANEGRGALGR